MRRLVALFALSLAAAALGVIGSLRANRTLVCLAARRSGGECAAIDEIRRWFWFYGPLTVLGVAGMIWCVVAGSRRRGRRRPGRQTWF